jgi:uncharacterized alkaline shock family protein YloU
MPEEPTRGVPGRTVVARRALSEVVRDAVLGSYGVTSLAEPTLMARCQARLGLGSHAIRMTLHPKVSTEVWLTVAYGVPVAEVARQVDSAVRYALERALARDVGPVAIHVQGLRGGLRAPGPSVPGVTLSSATRPSSPHAQAAIRDQEGVAEDAAHSGSAAGVA